MGFEKKLGVGEEMKGKNTGANQHEKIKGIIQENQFMPEILRSTVEVLGDLNPNVDYNCRLNILLAKTVQMISSKCICFQELSNVKLANYYAINFMPSGMGKDKTCDDLDKFIFKNFLIYIKEKAEDYKSVQELKIETDAINLYPKDEQLSKRESYIEAEKGKLRDLEIEINSSTIEGFFADAKALDEAGFGSLFVKLSEFGMFLQNGRKDDLLFFTGLLEAYDGKVSSKSTKFGKREKSIENIPVNILLHSDYNLFKSDIQIFFDKLMQTGFTRRSIVSFQENNIQKIENNPKEALKRQEKAYKKANLINEKLFSIFLSIPNKAVYKLTNEAYEKTFYPYHIKIAELSNANYENDKLSKEIRSRELKVLKLATIFAALNHPTELFIHELDVEQAINVVEQLSQDFKRFMNYKIETKDNYELLLNFLIDNTGKEFTKTVLVNKYSEFGFKRAAFRADFDNILDIVSEMASEKGYYLQNERINNNSGQGISLVKNNIGTSLPEGVKELDDLV